MTADPFRHWPRAAFAVIAGVTLLRLAWLALGLAPVHFDEAQYWSYGEEPAFGYYSKPPLAAWLIRAATEVFGDTVFGLRVMAPLLHAAIAAIIFAVARRLFDPRVGFWAVVVYLLAPGVMASSGLMTTDPPMMLGTALALYALVRAMQGGGLAWFALSGLAVGVGMLSKYTGIAFLGGALGYALFAREGRLRPVVVPVMLGAALLALSPNLLWNAQNDFATIAHVGDNANLGVGPLLKPLKMLEFFGAQFAVFGPVAFALLLLLLIPRRHDWRLRLLLWLSVPLITVMTGQALLSRAHPNWAAPAYVPAAIAVAAFALETGRLRWLRAGAVIGLAAWIGFWGLSAVYTRHTELPRLFDPYKKMRKHGPVCEAALAMMDRTGADALLSDDRRVLADCMFLGGFGTDRIAVWNPIGPPRNHYELVATLAPGDPRRFILIDFGWLGWVSTQFARAGTPLAIEARTHADRTVAFSLIEVEGFR